MCGIAAAIGVEDGLGVTRRALEHMVHRGPDGSGVTETGLAALGMCRLQVREPEAITLPIGHGGLSCGYNGEVYGGYRSDLPPPDTVQGEIELLLEDRPLDVDGMWAMVTMSDRSLVLSRDRWGIRPLYYRALGSGWVVASEINALKKSHPVSISSEAVQEVLLFGTPLSHDSVYPEIRAVAPGSLVLLAAGGRGAAHVWSTALPSPPLAAFDARCSAADAVSSAIRESLRRSLVGNRPIGLALSGGLDSQLLGSYLLELRVPSVTLVSVIVEGVEDDGPAAAQRLLEAGGTELGWTSVTTAVDPARYLALLDRAGRVVPEPIRMSSVPLYLALADAAADAGVVVLVTGEGADELFLGYESYRGLVGSRLTPNEIADHYLPQNLRRWGSALVGEQAMDRCADLHIEQIHASAAQPDRLRPVEFQRSLRPLLERCDVCLMSRSVEGRTPYLHGDVPDVACTLSAAELLSGGGKAPLREIGRRRLGKSIGRARKVPFRAPIARWLGTRSGSFGAEVRLRVRRACRALDFSRSASANLVRACAEGDAQAAGLTAGLLSVDTWLES